MKDLKSVLRIVAREKHRSAEEEKKKEKIVGDEPSVTYHTIQLNGKTIRYKATAGYLKMKDENQKIKSRSFYIAYELDDIKDRSKRPITFAFNGGPGAASAWVHFGCMGPKRITTTDDGHILPPPYKYEDNLETWLDFTDLVFMDPIGTGFSTPGKDEDPKQFYGVEEDLKAGGDFIRLYVTKNERWLSPKYVAGESYGTFRGAGLASYLQTRHALDLNGVVMISSVLNFLTFDFAPGNDMPFLMFFPAYAATAHYHKKLCPELMENLEKTVAMAEEWALNEYSVALIKGNRLSPDERKAVAEKISYFTGLPVDFICDCNLRVDRNRFLKQLLHGERMVLGPYDARMMAHDVDPAADHILTDPSMFNVYGSCIATLNHFISKELKYENELPYRPLSRDVNEMWNWGSGIEGRMGYVNVTEKLAQAISYNKYLKVFLANGYYDLCTPYFLNRHTVDHLALSPELSQNITFKCYEGGHMMYVIKDSRMKLKEDLRAFYAS